MNKRASFGLQEPAAAHTEDKIPLNNTRFAVVY
jgi:hypothetical protein